MSTPSRAVVLLSGGLDSATVLAMARLKHECYCLSFDYGQRHLAELNSACRISARLGAKEHRILCFDLAQFGGSALTDVRIDIPTSGVVAGEIPVTYVPARNTVLLAMALAWAEALGARHLYIGVNAVDYSGYPDCRPEFIAAFEHMANLATKAAVEGAPIQIHTPLIQLSKAEIIKEGTALGVPYEETVSCYQASSDGAACRVCDACRLRRDGFIAAGVNDPTIYRAAP